MVNSIELGVKSLWSLLLAEGIFVTILGFLVIMIPRISTFTLGVLLSVGLIILGLCKLVNSIILRKEHPCAWIATISSILIITAGIYLTLNPFFNILVLTLFIGIFFILESINAILICIQKKSIYKYWWVTFFSAFVQLFLACIIIFGLPFTTLWTIGTLIGINLVFNGLSIISVYYGTRVIAAT